MQKLHTMELSWIQDFIALNDTRNFTVAANARNSTQPAFSRRIQNLESWLGASLFDRNARPVVLTSSGKEFEKRAYRLREDMFDSRRIVNLSATNLSDAITIYTTNTIAVGLLPQWIADQKISPYRLVVSSVYSCLEAVRQKRCDYALIPSFADVDETLPKNAQHIVDDKMVFMMPKNKKIELKKGLIHGQVLMYSPKTAFGRVIDTKMKKLQLILADKPVCESASAEALLAQVRSGMGGGWVIHSLVNPHDKLHKVKELFDIPFKIMLINSAP